VADPAPPAQRRILIVDDNASIHLDFRKVLGAQAEQSAQAALDVLEASLFGETVAAASRPSFDIDSAHQGQEGVDMVRQALAEGRPYAMAFIDMRMPPGWDGLKTIEHLWTEDPDVQVVICSAHTDYDWTEVVDRLGHSDKLLVLRKPAEPIEVLQCATALSRKWENDRLVRDQMLRLEEVITTRTRGLEAANQQLRHLATHDALTGLPNRVLLDDRLQQAIAHADRDMRSFALLVCDLDRFKLINDSLGHRAGDELLQEVAARLSSVVRTADTVARTGGNSEQTLAEPDHSVERGHRSDLPAEGDQAEREQVQRVEHDRRERRVGERQREIRCLVRIDVVVEAARVIDGGRTTDVDVQVDEIGTIGSEIRPSQPRGNAQDE